MSLDASTARERRYGRWLLIAVLPIVLVSLLPLFYTIISSFRPGSEIFQFLSPLSINTFWPQEITLDNYTTLLSGDFLRALLNSVIVTSLTVVLGLAVASLAAFGLAVFDFPFKNTLLFTLLRTRVLPPVAVIIPYFVMFSVLFLFFLVGMIQPRFNYWRLEPNEFVHYIQPWGRDQSIPRQGSTVAREVPDMLELCPGSRASRGL